LEKRHGVIADCGLVLVFFTANSQIFFGFFFNGLKPVATNILSQWDYDLFRVWRFCGDGKMFVGTSKMIMAGVSCR
jgi:hypothetical protein